MEPLATWTFQAYLVSGYPGSRLAARMAVLARMNECAMSRKELGDSSRVEDLTTYLDAATLVSVWPDLYVPKGVRRAWEEQHQSLRARVSA